MGKVTWGGDLDANKIDKADRSQFKPYAGPAVPDGLYAWRIKVLKRGKSSNKNDQLIVGLELVPRSSRPEEKVYAGYFVTDYITLTEAAAWRVAGFTDAIGVTGVDLMQKTKDTGEKDSKGSIEIVSIGGWKHTKKALILAQIAKGEDNKGKARTDVKGYWAPEALTEDPTTEPDEAEDDEEDEGEEDAQVYTREELKAMKLKDLKALYLATCEEQEEDPEDLDDIKKGALIDLYLALVEDEEDDEDTDDEDDTDEEPETEPEPPKKAAAKGKAEKATPAKATKGKPKGKAKNDEDDEDDSAPF